MVTEALAGKIIIEGITNAGEIFRPSDWADRIGGNYCTFKDRRIVYSPLLQPTSKDGYKCLEVDLSLKETNPEMFESIMFFAKTNDLKITPA